MTVSRKIAGRLVAGLAAAAAVLALSAGVAVVLAHRDHRTGASGPPGPAASSISVRLRSLTPVSAPVAAVAFTPDGRTLAVQLATGVVQLREPVTGAVRISVRPAANPGTHVSGTMAVSPDGTIIAAGIAANNGAGSAVELISVATGKVTATIGVSSPAVRSLAFSPDGKTLALAGGRTLFLLNLATRALIKASADEGAAPGPGTFVSFSPDGKFLAVASTLGLVKLWNVRAARFTKSTTVDPAGRPPGALVRAMTFSPDGSMIAVSGDLASPDNGPAAPQTWLWRPPEGRLRPLQPATVQDGASDENRAQAFSPDGKLIAIGDDTGVIRLWDTASAALIDTRNAPSGINPVTAVAFSPDGKSLVTVQSSVSSGPAGSATLQAWGISSPGY